jgi:hypothetical protein
VKPYWAHVLFIDFPRIAGEAMTLLVRTARRTLVENFIFVDIED